jgi:hypothetical protein
VRFLYTPIKPTNQVEQSLANRSFQLPMVFHLYTVLLTVMYIHGFWFAASAPKDIYLLGAGL